MPRKPKSAVAAISPEVLAQALALIQSGQVPSPAVKDSLTAQPEPKPQPKNKEEALTQKLNADPLLESFQVPVQAQAPQAFRSDPRKAVMHIELTLYRGQIENLIGLKTVLACEGEIHKDELYSEKDLACEAEAIQSLIINAGKKVTQTYWKKLQNKTLTPIENATAITAKASEPMPSITFPAGL